MLKKIYQKLQNTHTTRDFLGGFFTFPFHIYHTISVVVRRKIAQYRVQKMLANNIIPYVTEKKNTKEKKKTVNWTSFQMGLPRTYRTAASIFAVSFLILVILTSQYYGPQIIEAEIRLQNFMKADQTVDEGYDLLKYETRSESVIDSKAEFDEGSYSHGNFEADKDDVTAISAVDDYLTLGHYGAAPPDASQNEWWQISSQELQVCAANKFNMGTYTNTQWDGTNNWVELNSAGLTAGNGSYTSPVLDASNDISWSTMQWSSQTPTLKQLPDNAAAETGYNDGNVNMNGNVLMMHMNETSGAITDTSGQGNHGTYNGTGYSAAGRFSTGIDFDGTDDEIVIADSSSLVLNSVTASVWINFDSVAGWQSFFHKNTTTASTNDLYFEQNNGRLYNYNTISTSGAVLTAGQWYHLVYTADSITERLYLNGQILVEEPSQYIGTNNTNALRIGGSGGSGEMVNGRMDEAALWNRALSTEEVSDLYRRGANRLLFQVRSCDDSVCSGESFIGPDGTSATYYTEEMNASLGLPTLSLTNVPDNRFFQYRTMFESSSATLSPELICTTINQADEQIWDHRKCFDIDHTAAGSQDQSEYQVYLDVDTATAVTAGKMQADGDDIRFVDSDGTVLPYFIADDMNTASTRIWLKMDNIVGGTSEKICMYYGNDNISGVSSREDVFTYDNQTTIYHVVADTTEGSVTEFSSYVPDNDVTVGYYDTVLGQYESGTYPTGSGPTFTQTTAIRTTDPINAQFNANGTDTLVPVSFAGTSFVYRMDLWTNQFSFISPWCSANVVVRNHNNTIVTNGTFTVAQGGFNNLTTTNNASGLQNDSAVMIEVTNGCPIMATHHSTTGQGSVPLVPATTEWYGVPSGNLEIAALANGTTVTVYYSNNTSTTYNLARGGRQYIAVTGSEGSEAAARVVANNPIGVNGIDDTDGEEMQTFLPFNEMGYRYYVPQAMQYFAVATRAGITTKVDLYNDGTQCGVGVPSATYTVSPTGNFPGKVYFGSTTDGDNIAAGACVIADHPIAAYYEYAAQNDEHNILNEKHNRQFQYGVSQSVGAVQSGSWNVENITQLWSRRIPVTVTNTSTTPLTDYQIRLNVEAALPSLLTDAQSDGGDIRVAGSAGNGSDNIPYGLEEYTSIESSRFLWAKVPSVPANGSTTFYVYYQPVLTLQTCNAAEFAEGIYNNTQWDGTDEWTELTTAGVTAGTGYYESEVFDTSLLASWVDLSWVSNYPTYKELPNNLAGEVDYGDGNADMSTNLLLVHLNESSGTINNSSGVTNNGTYNGSLYGQSGRFNTSLGFDGVDDHVDFGQDLSTVIGGTGSVAFWMNTTQVGSDTPWTAPGITGSEQANTGNDVFWGYITANGRIAIQAGNTTGAFSTTRVNDGMWHHVTLTRNATTGVVQVYVDGILEGTATSETGVKTQYFNSIGRIYDSSGSHGWYQGRLDEVSFWSDIMDSSVVYDQYRRGANRLTYQMRSCDDSDCVGETFVGPDGTGMTFYSEQTNDTLSFPITSIDNLSDNRYIQYRATFDTDETSMSPELECVKVTYLGSPLSTTGDYNAIFHTQEPKSNYYIVDSRSVTEQLVAISFRDGNRINDTVTTRTVNEGEIITLPFTVGMDQYDHYDVTGPLSIGFTGNATDAALPIAYAGTEFVYRVDAGTDVFSFYAPFSAANVQIQQSSTAGWTTLQTVTVNADSVETITQDIVNARAFRIISDQPILGFHQASSDNSFIMYPTDLAREQDSGRYELYGVASGTLSLAASSTANVTLYRSNGTTSNVTLNAAGNFVYTESGSGTQGTAYAYHIVSDVPIGATSYNDGDGTEMVVFVSQKEFSEEYVLPNPAQYISVVAKDPSTTCRVYNASGTEVTTDGTGTMNYIPPQTGGTQVDPYPNRIIIGGTDNADGALFSAGSRMQCTQPVYAYYEHHVSAAISDETSWLTWPQVRKRAHVQPAVEDPDTVGEQGLFYSSGSDSATTGTDYVAYAEYTFDTSALIYGEHTYWRDVIWEEIVNSRSATNGVDQVDVEVAYADPAPNCNSATYSTFTAPSVTTLATSVDTTLPHVTYTTNTQRIILPDTFSDHSCVRARIYLRTGDQLYSPRINDIAVGHYIPTLLEDQLSGPTINVIGATEGEAERYRVIKAVTNDPGFNNSNVFTTFRAVSNGSVFAQADTNFLHIQSQSSNEQFTFPPFPGTLPVNAATTSVFDASHDIAVYFTHERTTGGVETLDYVFNVDVAGTNGAQVSRDFRLNVGGL
jgi:hypothetical protein